MDNVVTIAMFKHLDSPDNALHLRSRDLEPSPEQIAALRKCVRPIRRILHGIASVYDATYCPTTKRHLHTAVVFAESVGLPMPIPDSRINNIDYGIYKGKPAAETPMGPEFIDTPYEGGTSWAYVAAQWRSFLEDVARRHSGRAILLAGQSSVGPKMLAHLCEGVPLLEVMTRSPRRSVWHYHLSEGATGAAAHSIAPYAVVQKSV
jgi:broad specificity phosphatase PhoE